MTRALFLLIAAASLSSCTARFRAPPCPPHHWELPTAAVGVYRITFFSVASPDAARKNQTIDGRLAINATASAYELQASRSLVRNANSAGGGTSPVTATLIGLQDFSAACSIDGHAYLQLANDDGTYSLLQVEASSAGLGLNPIGFDYGRLRAGGYQVIDTPKLHKNADGLDYPPSRSVSIDNTVIDNAHFDPAATEVLFSHAQTVSVGYFFARVSTSEPSFLTSDEDVVSVSLPRR